MLAPEMLLRRWQSTPWVHLQWAPSWFCRGCCMWCAVQSCRPDEPAPAPSAWWWLGRQTQRVDCRQLQVSDLLCPPIQHMFDGIGFQRVWSELDVPAVCGRCNAICRTMEQATRTSTWTRRRSPARCRVCQSSWLPGTPSSWTAASQVSRCRSPLTTL